MKTIAAVAVLIVFFNAPALAQDRGFYLGASVGQVQHQDACGAAAFSCDDKDTGFRLSAGYQFLRYFALELGYADLGESFAGETIAGAGVNVKREVMASDLTAVGILPLGERFSLFAKLGTYAARTELAGSGARVGGPPTFTRTVVTVSGEEVNAGLTFGLGAGFQFTRNFGMRAEWQRYAEVGGDEIGEVDIDVMSLGLLYRF